MGIEIISIERIHTAAVLDKKDKNRLICWQHEMVHDRALEPTVSEIFLRVIPRALHRRRRVTWKA